MTHSRLLCLSALAAALFAPATEAAICRVTPTGSANGASWSTPMSFQGALNNTSCNEIWLRKGLYKPVLPANVTNPTEAERATSFAIAPGTRVYGGFSGTETLRDQRSPATNRAVLSGDLDNNDLVDADGIVTHPDGVRYANSYHVVTLNGGTARGPVTRATVLDGVTITSGRATGNSTQRQDQGGGALCQALGTGQECSPTLRDVVFSGNVGRYGAAMAVIGVSGGIGRPWLHRVRFTANQASSNGGGLYNDGQNAGQASPELVDAEFAGNLANQGGAIYNDGRAGNASPDINRVAFSNNSAGYGGALYNDATNSGKTRARITNATFAGNTSSNDGGAIYNYTSSNGDARMTLTHVTFSGNAAHKGGAIFNYGGNNNQVNSGQTLRGAILSGNSATQSDPEIGNYRAEPVIQGSLVAGGCPAGAQCSDLIAGNPALAALADNGGFSRTMKPNTGSAAIDAANSAWCPVTDQRGIARAQGTRCDLGAVEVEVPPCYVKHDASGSNNGSSWANAYKSLQGALGNASCGEIRVARGIYKPTEGGDRNISFDIRPGQRVYGGFAGNEATLEQRNPAANRTVLSGDIDNNDVADADGVVVDTTHRNGNNSHRIVLMDGTTAAGNITATTVLDGFAITAAAGDRFGAGLHCKGSGNGRECSPTLRNLLISANSGDAGGGMFNDGTGGRANPTLINVTFRNNTAWMGAGAMENRGWSGGDASPTLVNVTFSGNWITAMVNEGINGGKSSPSLNHVTFHGNRDRYDAASMYNRGTGGGISQPVLSNVIMWGGTFSAPEEPGCTGSTHPEICNISAQPTIRNSLIAGGCPAGAICDASVRALDPKLGPLANNGGATPTFMPGADSPAIDQGADDDCPETDQRDVSRPQGARCDIGAVERTVLDVGGGDDLFADGFESH